MSEEGDQTPPTEQPAEDELAQENDDTGPSDAPGGGGVEEQEGEEEEEDQEQHADANDAEEEEGEREENEEEEERDGEDERGEEEEEQPQEGQYGEDEEQDEGRKDNEESEGQEQEEHGKTEEEGGLGIHEERSLQEVGTDAEAEAIEQRQEETGASTATQQHKTWSQAGTDKSFEEVQDIGEDHSLMDKDPDELEKKLEEKRKRVRHLELEQEIFESYLRRHVDPNEDLFAQSGEESKKSWRKKRGKKTEGAHNANNRSKIRDRVVRIGPLSERESVYG
eukprot:gb/GECG01000511.1/.p1 GENE.gb/GECG01000511.1/~~gb/GECG01000511.1/.p1  ORF type:complete len:280 (+),score=96.06 gb/GECG01000511.1/:1-840(+)